MSAQAGLEGEMTVAGIIAECNPFHEGHAYLIEQARQKTNADYVVVALSGDFVQRGIPAVMSWENRVGRILEEGADLVAALPLYAACSGADYFARGGAALLEKMGVVTDIVFGSEGGDLKALVRTAQALDSAGRDAEASEQFRESLRQAFRQGQTYADAVASAAGEMPRQPNDLLGAHYIRALQGTGSGIRPHAVKRIRCLSASERREQLLKGGRGASEIPLLSAGDLSGQLLHALMMEEDLSVYLDVSKDLSNRIRSLLPEYRGWEEFAMLLKTRNLTYSHVSRALLHILLGMRQDTMRMFDEKYGLCGWIRPLGMRRSAAPLLKAMKSTASVPFLDKLSAADRKLSPELYGILMEEIRAEMLYDLSSAAAGYTGAAAGYTGEGDHRRSREKERTPQQVRSAFSKQIILI